MLISRRKHSRARSLKLEAQTPQGVVLKIMGPFSLKFIIRHQKFRGGPEFRELPTCSTLSAVGYLEASTPAHPCNPLQPKLYLGSGGLGKYSHIPYKATECPQLSQVSTY